MILTCSTWCFQHLPEYADAALPVREIRRLGLAPELWQNWAPDPACFDRAHWETWRRLAGGQPALSLHTRNQRERMFEEIEFLAFLGGRTLVVHPCVLSLPGHAEERPDLAFVRELAAAARARGVFLALENIFGRAFLDRTLDGVATFDAQGGLGICLDVGHAQLKRAEPREAPVDLIRDYGRVLLHLHVHDVVGTRDHQPLGSGQTDYAAIAAALRGAGFSGTIALEIQCPDPLGMIAAGREFLARHFGAALDTGAPGRRG